MAHVNVTTGPQPMVSDESQEMRAKANEVFAEAMAALSGAISIRDEIEAMRQGNDIIADTLMSVREPREKRDDLH